MTPQEEREAACEADDMFGPRPPPAARPRVPMISARLRANEERKKVIKICSQKLESIRDPVCDLRRSVCINNTYCRLSEEVQREKEARRRGRTDFGDTTDRALDRALASIESELAAIGAAVPPPDGELLALEPVAPKKRSSSPPCPVSPKRSRYDDEEDSLAGLLDSIPELGDGDCASLARRELPLLLPNMLAVLDS